MEGGPANGSFRSSLLNWPSLAWGVSVPPRPRHCPVLSDCQRCPVTTAVQETYARGKACARSCKQLISVLISGTHPSFSKLKRALSYLSFNEYITNEAV